MTASSLPFSHLVMDFDGTCTQVPAVAADYLEAYRSNFSIAFAPVSREDWKVAVESVDQHSPEAGWTAAGAPAAPAAADPYILADEAARFILRQHDKPGDAPPSWVNAQAYASLPAPWRLEAADVFQQIITMGLKIHFISNSSSLTIQHRLYELFVPEHPVFKSISIQSDAAKFRICEPLWEAGKTPPQCRERFDAVPAVFTHQIAGPRRPIYLRRGAYFAAICRALGNDCDELAKTLFCGDIWEMDLAMPYALGARVHLLDRAPPFRTYDYENLALAACGERGKTSGDLSGLLEWFT